jgi:hypothetical protein
VGNDLETLAQHEFAHAIDMEYNISGYFDPRRTTGPIKLRDPADNKIQKLFSSMSETEITEGLSSYAASSPSEMIAEGFAEGLRPDSRPLGIQIKKIIDDIVREADAVTTP